MMTINLEGVWRLANAAVPAMLERPRPRQGRFVAVASAGGTRGLPLLSAYSAAKHGVIGFVRSLAAELGPEGITANAVAPGSTTTAMLDASAAVYGIDPQDFAAHLSSAGSSNPRGRRVAGVGVQRRQRRRHRRRPARRRRHDRELIMPFAPPRTLSTQPPIPVAESTQTPVRRVCVD